MESRRALGAALVLTASYTVVEVVGGVLAGSLALLADAVHMLSDNVALAVALVAAWLATKPATPERSFGFKRAEVLAALANGVMLVALAIWIFVEATMRLRDPGDVLGGWMLAIALVGLAVNVGAGFILSRARHHSLNVEAAFRHVFVDLLGSLGVAIAAVVILATGWVEADPLVSILIGVLVLASAWSILRDSTEILLESTPRGIDAGALGRRLHPRPGSSRCTTSTCGRSRQGSRRSPRTSSSGPARTATVGAASSSGSCTPSSESSTRPCRSTTPARPGSSRSAASASVYRRRKHAR